MAFDRYRVLAVVPARGGSKGIVRKNLQEINYQSLIAITSTFIQTIDWIDRAIVSTDDEQILEEARRVGLEVPFVRPADLAQDNSRSIDMWAHALIESEKHFDTEFHLSILLEPTSPIRKAGDLESVMRKIVEGCFDSVFTVSASDSKAHPLKQLKIQNGRVYNYLSKGGEITARQQLESVYHRNGVAYVMTRDALLEKRPIVGDNSSVVVIREPTINIDTYEDLELARYYFSKST